MFYLQQLHSAALHGDIEALKLCIQNGADIDNQEVSKIVPFNTLI